MAPTGFGRGEHKPNFTPTQVDRYRVQPYAHNATFDAQEARCEVRVCDNSFLWQAVEGVGRQCPRSCCSPMDSAPEPVLSLLRPVSKKVAQRYLLTDSLDDATL